jgi:hypothetical protein
LSARCLAAERPERPAPHITTLPRPLPVPGASTVWASAAIILVDDLVDPGLLLPCVTPSKLPQRGAMQLPLEEGASRDLNLAAAMFGANALVWDARISVPKMSALIPGDIAVGSLGPDEIYEPILKQKVHHLKAEIGLQNRLCCRAEEFALSTLCLEEKGEERSGKRMGISSRLCWAAAINLILLDSCLSWCPTASFARGVGFPLSQRHHGRVQGVASGVATVRRTRTNIASGARCSTVRDVATQEDLMNVVQFASQALPNRYAQGVCLTRHPDKRSAPHCSSPPGPVAACDFFVHSAFCLAQGKPEAGAQDSDEFIMLRTGPTER